MKIKRTSWHYRINHIGSDFESNNLCTYFWRLVGKIALFGSAAFLFCVLAHAHFTSPFVIPNSILILSIIFCAIVPAVAIHYIRLIPGKQREVPGVNIATEFIKAQKDKICPLIEYVN